MLVRVETPVIVNGLAAARWYLHFVRDPLQAVAKIYATHGPFIQLPHPRAPARERRVLLVAIGPAFNREVLDNPNAWRTVDIGPGGPKYSAARRLTQGIIRMTGRQHSHYRRLLLPPLQRKSIDAMGADMVSLAQEQVACWQAHQPIDLWAHVKKLLRTFAIGLLFGDDRSQGYPIADMINQTLDNNWSWKISACPVNLAGTPYYHMLRNAEELERRIIEWGDCKRGQIDNRDLLSIVVNSPDENGRPASHASVVGHTPTLFGAGYETCQSALIWTLLLLDQHPQIARQLYDELQCSGAGHLPSYQQLMQLPLLDAVIKESLRILPPVPQQFRIAQHNTMLNGYPVAERTRVMLSSLLTNRERDIYPDGDRFKPERWATMAPSSYEYSVFSAGPRGCPGYAFGLAMLKVAIATIMSRYRIALQPDTRIDYKVGVTLSPRRAIPAVLNRQDGAFASVVIRGTIRNLVRLPT